MSVAVALDDLRADGRGLELQALADAPLDFRTEVSEGADRAGDFPHFHIGGGLLEAPAVALQLAGPVGQHQAKGGGLGVDAVGAPDHDRVFELVGALLQNVSQARQPLPEQVVGLAHQQRGGGVEHVGAGEAVVEVAGFGAGLLGDRQSEGDEVVANFALDFRHALRRRWLGGGAQLLRGFFGDLPAFGQGVGGGQLNFQPLGQLVFVGPDAAHGRSGVTRNHAATPSTRSNNGANA